MAFEIRATVHLKTRRGVVRGVVAGRRLKRNGTWEYTIQEADPQSGTGVWRAAEHMLSHAPALTEAQKDQALKKCQDFHKSNEEVRDARLRANQEALDRLGVSVGDDVVIKFRDGASTKRVLRVAHDLGKIGISSPGSRDHRLIEARHIERVQTPDTAPIPVNLITERMLDELQADGATRVRFARGFTQESYVIAFTREMAKDTRWDEDGASGKVYFDPFYSLYWRATGCLG